MKKLLLILFLLNFSNSLFSQPVFQKIYGLTIYPETANDIQKTFDGGYIIGGYAYRPQTFGANDLYFLKISNTGAVQYGKLLGRTGYKDIIESIRQTSDSGFISLTRGQLSTGGNYKSSLVKTNSQGVIQWNKQFQNGTSSMTNANVEITSDGGFIVATSQYVPSIPQYRVNLQKMDSNGDTLWTRVYASVGGAYISTVKQTADNGYIMGGYATGIVQPGKPFLLKVNSSGDIQWYKTYSLGGSVFLNWCEITSDGGFVFTATKNSVSQDTAKITVVKTDNLGNPTWAKLYENADAIFAHKIIETSTGDFLITGNWLDSAHTNRDVVALKIDDTGNLLWSKRYGSNENDYGLALLDLPGTGHMIAGYYQTPNGAYPEVYLIQMDVNGNSDCNENTLTITTISQTAQLDTMAFIQSHSPYTISSLTYGTGNAIDQTTLCSTVGENELEFVNSISLYPNPATDFVEVFIPNNSKDYKVSVINSLGCEVHNSILSQGEKIVTSGLTDGLYFLRIQLDENLILKKLMIIR